MASQNMIHCRSLDGIFVQPAAPTPYINEAVRKCAYLVDLEKCCQTDIYLQHFVLIQPRTSYLQSKIYKILRTIANLTDCISNFANFAQDSTQLALPRCGRNARPVAPTWLSTGPRVARKPFAGLNGVWSLWSLGGASATFPQTFKYLLQFIFLQLNTWACTDDLKEFEVNN